MYYSWKSRIIVVMKENAQSKENPANTSEWNSSSVYIFSTLFPCFSREGTIQSNEYLIWNESCTFHVRWTYWKSWITQLEFSDYLNILCYRCNCTAELESLFWYMWQCLARSRRGFWCVQYSAVHVERKKTDEIFKGNPCNLVFHTGGINFYIQDAFLLLPDPSFILF